MANSTLRSSISYLEDVNLVISSKDGQVEKPVMPPKIKGKHFTNMEYLANAEFVWLTPAPFPSRIYDPNSDDSYFEQVFRTCGKLGEGSFGSVIKVRSLEDNQLYAMKVSKEPFRNEFDRKLKLREVEHHFSLSTHPNIVTLHKAWEEDRFVFMQMELCKPSVEDGVALSEETCWQVLADMSLALDHIHQSGRAHFDIKVENILLGEDNLFKLSDFGLMFYLSEDMEALKEGDAKYVAPELILGGVNQFTQKADIFSLGISVLEMAGNLDLPSHGPVWVALRESKFPFAQTKHLSDELFELLMKMMSRDPAQRPSAQEILALPRVKKFAREVNVVMIPSNGELATSFQSSSTSESGGADLFSSISSLSDEALNETSACRAPQTLFSSTPMMQQTDESGYSEGEENHMVKKLKRMREERESLNSDGMEESGPSGSSCPSPPPLTPPPSQIHCDWVGLTSPDRAIRDASVNRNRLHCPSQSLLQYGISPLRLSKAYKRSYREQKRKTMTPRNLASSFNNDDFC